MIIPQVFALVLFFLIPILLYVFTIMILKYSNENSTSKVRRWLYTARKPLGFKSLSNEDLQQMPDEDRSQFVQKEVILRLLALYIVVAVFFLSNIVGSFYTIIADVAQDIGNAGSSELRTWSAIAFPTPFSGGWVGTFPWYGYGLWPPGYLEIYHEPWNWVFHTTALVDGNPNFFSNITTELIVLPLAVGIVLLLPLARRSVREAFLPSIVHLHFSMLVIVSTLFNCFAEAFKLVVLSNELTYGQYVVAAVDLNGLPSTILAILSPVLLLVFVLFFGISYKLGGTHYGDSTKAKWLFVANTSILYWMSLLLAILV